MKQTIGEIRALIREALDLPKFTSPGYTYKSPMYADIFDVQAFLLSKGKDVPTDRYEFVRYLHDSSLMLTVFYTPEGQSEPVRTWAVKVDGQYYVKMGSSIDEPGEKYVPADIEVKKVSHPRLSPEEKREREEMVPPRFAARAVRDILKKAKLPKRDWQVHDVAAQIVDGHKKFMKNPHVLASFRILPNKIVAYEKNKQVAELDLDELKSFIVTDVVPASQHGDWSDSFNGKNFWK